MTIASALIDGSALKDVAFVSLSIGLAITFALAIAVRASLLAQDAKDAGEPSKVRLQTLIALTAVFVSVAIFVLGIYEIASK